MSRKRLAALLIAALAIGGLFLGLAHDPSTEGDYPLYRQMIRAHELIDPNVPDNSVIFLGDSHVQGLAAMAVATPAVNFGIGGDTTVGVLKRLPIYTSTDSARLIVLAIGINDFWYREPEAIAENIAEIWRQLPDVPLITSPILPVDERVDQDRPDNREIAAVNAKLADAADNHSNVYFLDVDLTDESGNLAAELHSGDGLHLSPAGYSEWIRALKSAVNSQ